MLRAANISARVGFPVVFAALIWCVCLPAGSASKANGRGCHPGTVAQNRYFTLYRKKPALLIACRRSNGGTFVEAGGYLPHTADLTGPNIADASFSCDEEDTNDCNTFVLARDVINDPNGGIGADAGPKPFSKVGSVQLSRDLRLAWIACRLRHRPDLNKAPRRRPQCVKPGRARNLVYVKTSAKTPKKVLDRGRRIDPSSLKLRRGRLTWKHSGKRRSFDISELPARPFPTPTPEPTQTPTATASPSIRLL